MRPELAVDRHVSWMVDAIILILLYQNQYPIFGRNVFHHSPPYQRDCLLDKERRENLRELGVIQ